MTTHIYECYQCKMEFAVNEELEKPFRICQLCRVSFLKSLGLPEEWGSDDFLYDVNKAEDDSEVDDLSTEELLDTLHKLSDENE